MKAEHSIDPKLIESSWSSLAKLFLRYISMAVMGLSLDRWSDLLLAARSPNYSPRKELWLCAYLMCGHTPRNEIKGGTLLHVRWQSFPSQTTDHSNWKNIQEKYVDGFL